MPVPRSQRRRRGRELTLSAAAEAVLRELPARAVSDLVSRLIVRRAAWLRASTSALQDQGVTDASAETGTTGSP